ncbi:LysR family transcriptional regulator [Ruegeria arenilitoris]|uniref:LysR family transcriptional regulator n=1 Tax=Ruegeria arenilitoris TaxID=1173585 RepID=UPI00147B4323|nr:LysR substrate-binding domain-containing protein [Ruegeria arenilitoris]
MDLRHLRYFIAVAEELNFTRAAERLNMAQPPLSQQIRQLEEELGAVLLERGSRPLKLTRAGELLLENAQEVILLADRTRKDVARIGRGQVGQLNVAFVGSALYSLLPSVLNKFRQKYPEIEVSLNEMLAPDIVSALRERRADIGLIRPSLPDTGEFEQKLLVTEPLVLAVPEQHPIAGEISVPLAAIDGQPLILYPRLPKPSVTNNILRTCEAVGVEPEIVQEVLHIQTALMLVSAGVGLTLVARSVAAQQRNGLVFVEINSPTLSTELSLVWRTGGFSPSLTNFLTACEHERKIWSSNTT